MYSRRAEWKSVLNKVQPYPEGKFNGRGIIIPAGGALLESALVTGLMILPLIDFYY